MTPKNKAEELVKNYLNMNDGLIQEFIPIPIEGARQCALVAVDEILQEYWSHNTERRDWWKQVKQEIQNL
jgi:glutathione synthase/RimK-type ligase-like ATP-grasp enzyme